MPSNRNSLRALQQPHSGAMPRVGSPGAGFGNISSKERPRRTWPTVRRLGAYLGRQRRILALVVLLLAGIVAFDLTGPILLGRAIDRHIVGRDLHGLGLTLTLMALVYAGSFTLNFILSHLMAGVAQRTIRDLRSDLFARLQRLPLQFFDSRSHGELMANIISDVDSVDQVLSNSVTQIVTGVLSTASIGIAMFIINPWLALACVVVVSSLTIGSNRFLARRILERYRLQQSALGRLYGFIEETIEGQRVIKAYGQSPATLERFQKVNCAYRDAAVHAQSLSSVTPPMMNAINNLALSIVATVGGFLAIRRLTTVGTIATFINYTRQFGRPLNGIAILYNQLQSALAGAERVFEIIDQTPEVDAPRLSKMPSLAGHVVFEDIIFAYRAGTPVLRNIRLEAHPGQTIALIGPTGAGKTTIVNLLMRFYELEQGRILVDGADLRDYPKQALRRRIGIVLQDTFLFAGTIRENIRYGRIEAADDEVTNAAVLANADGFIRRMPQGYDTVLAERGSNLSHGQRQMLAIARAVLADPTILVLDEATSSVDTRTERLIQEAMHRLMAGRTSFVIAHRLSTIRRADQIIVINNGSVQERGTHAELFAQRGMYWRLSQRPGPTETPSRPLPQTLGDATALLAS